MNWRSILLISTGIIFGILIFSVAGTQALPEYAARTGEPCATCHVNPAGGGPLTTRGQRWAAMGKPDVVPTVPGEETPPQATPTPAAPVVALPGKAIYDKQGCGACHGAAGQGGVGPALDQKMLEKDDLTAVIREGKGVMPGYGSDRIGEAELADLVTYVQSFLRPPTPTPAPILSCGQQATPEPGETVSCGGN